jgi:hypothetical protein
MARYSNYAPAFQLTIDGGPLPGALQASIISVNYQDGMEGADRVEVTFANPNLQWLDHPLLQVNNGFKLSIGYAPDPLEQVFVGEITGVEPNFPASGMPTIKVVAQDFLQRLTHGKVDRAFYIPAENPIDNFPIPDVAVAAIVAGSNLLIPYPDPVGGALSIIMTLATYVNVPGLMQKSIQRQESQSDFDFLSKISRQNGWEMYIDHTMEPQGYVLRFQFLLQDYSASLTLTRGESLMDFTPRITTAGDVYGVSARIWISAIKMEFVIIVGWDFDDSQFTLAVYPGIGNLETLLGAKAAQTVSIKPTSFPTTVQSVLSELLPRLNNRLTASGSTIGNPAIKASRVINVQGVGDQFGGLYRVTQATHTFDSGGYRTSFQARKEVWFGSLPLPKSPAGAFRVQGQTV